MSKLRPDIVCRECGGRGMISLPEGLWQTLLFLLRSNKPVSVETIFRASPDKAWIQKTAINNRLIELEKLKLASREKRGREYFWTAL